MESPACPSARGQPACFLVTGSVSARLTSRVSSREPPRFQTLLLPVDKRTHEGHSNTVTGTWAGGCPTWATCKCPLGISGSAPSTGARAPPQIHSGGAGDGPAPLAFGEVAAHQPRNTRTLC